MNKEHVLLLLMQISYLSVTDYSINRKRVLVRNFDRWRMFTRGIVNDSKKTVSGLANPIIPCYFYHQVVGQTNSYKKIKKLKQEVVTIKLKKRGIACD